MLGTLLIPLSCFLCDPAAEGTSGGCSSRQRGMLFIPVMSGPLAKRTVSEHVKYSYRADLVLRRRVAREMSESATGRYVQQAGLVE
jgi:hypothetical protein